MTEIKLLPHNQNMVDEIERAMVMGYHKIFYTEATGLGKSFIMMYLINKYFRDKKVLYICPKNHIWYNMNLYKEFELIEDCVTMTCYADFNNIKEKHFGYDAIFIDEVHHLTAPLQGENIRRVVEITIQNNPHAFVFGFTATPYVGSKMIGDMYFEKSIIGMNFIEAIDNGILQKINYAVAIKEEIELKEHEFKLIQKFNVHTTHQTVTDIVHRYSNVRHWLVYFTYIDELNANIEYFEKYFPEYKLFIIHSDVADCENILNEFETYEGNAFLLSVSMVLEGIHPRTVEGILLYRNIYSNNTFLQIVGRLGIINPVATPIFVDIYSSYEKFLTSGLISDIVYDSGSSKKHHKFHKNINRYIYVHSKTYEFLELSEVIYNYRYNIKSYRDLEWSNNTELSKKLGRGRDFVKRKIMQGYTHKQIIDNILDGNWKRCDRYINHDTVFEYRGYKWSNNADLSRQLGKHRHFVKRKIMQGYTHKQIIDCVLDEVDKSSDVNTNDVNPNDDTPKEYKGYKWSNNAELSTQLGRGKNFVSLKIRQGYTHKQIIDNILDGNWKRYDIILEYKGYKWTSPRDLSKQLGKSKSYVDTYLRKGYTYDQIIDKFLDRKPKEYKGYKWISYMDLSRQLGKPENYVGKNIFAGYTCEQIIDRVISQKIHTYRDYTWKSSYELDKLLGKYSGYVANRIKRKGQTYEQIIDEFLDSKSGV